MNVGFNDEKGQHPKTLALPTKSFDSYANWLLFYVISPSCAIT